MYPGISVSHKISHKKFVIYRDSYLQAMVINDPRLNITSTNESTGKTLNEVELPLTTSC